MSPMGDCRVAVTGPKGQVLASLKKIQKGSKEEVAWSRGF